MRCSFSTLICLLHTPARPERSHRLYMSLKLRRAACALNKAYVMTPSYESEEPNTLSASLLWSRQYILTTHWFGGCGEADGGHGHCRTSRNTLKCGRKPVIPTVYKESMPSASIPSPHHLQYENAICAGLDLDRQCSRAWVRAAAQLEAINMAGGSFVWLFPLLSSRRGPPATCLGQTEKIEHVTFTIQWQVKDEQQQQCRDAQICLRCPASCNVSLRSGVKVQIRAEWRQQFVVHIVFKLSAKTQHNHEL